MNLDQVIDLAIAEHFTSLECHFIIHLQCETQSSVAFSVTCPNMSRYHLVCFRKFPVLSDVASSINRTEPVPLVVIDTALTLTLDELMSFRSGADPFFLHTLLLSFFHYVTSWSSFHPRMLFQICLYLTVIAPNPKTKTLINAEMLQPPPQG